MVGSVLRRKFANRLPTGMRAASGGSVPCFCIKKFVDVPQLVGRRFGSDRRVQQERQNGAAKPRPRPGATAKSLFEQPQPAAAVALSAGSRPLEDAKPAGPSPLSHAGSARERSTWPRSALPSSYFGRERLSTFPSYPKAGGRTGRQRWPATAHAGARRREQLPRGVTGKRCGASEQGRAKPASNATDQHASRPCETLEFPLRMASPKRCKPVMPASKPRTTHMKTAITSAPITPVRGALVQLRGPPGAPAGAAPGNRHDPAQLSRFNHG